MLRNEKVNALRIQRSNNATYLLALPISKAIQMLEIPDPAHPFPDNRRVNKKHAMEFGNYWENHEHDWVVPPLLLDCPEKLSLKRISKEDKGSEIVEIQLPKGGRDVLRILDGQHRVLGWFLKKLELDTRLTDTNSMYNKALMAGKTQEANHYLDQISHIRHVMDRLENESVAVNIIDSLDSKLHQQFFVDIAKNALGINKTVQAKFDSASIVNRVTQRLIKKHDLLQGRVDLEKTSCSGNNLNLLTVVNVADITRHSCFGVNRMVTPKRENNYSDDVLAGNVELFLDIMMKNVPQLQDLINGHVSAPVFRETCMLGSGTIWRCLAGAFYEACVIIDDDLGTIEWDMSQVRRFEHFVSNLSSEIALPISSNWFATGLFPLKRSKAPSSRAQDLDSMVGLMTAWVSNERLFFPKTPVGI